MLSRFVSKLLKTNIQKILIISFIFSLLISICVGFALSVDFINEGYKNISSKSNKFDFYFTLDNRLKDEAINNISSKYNFDYEKQKAKKVYLLNANKLSTKYVGYQILASDSTQKKYNNYISKNNKIPGSGEVLVTEDFLFKNKLSINDTFKIDDKVYKIIDIFSSLKAIKGEPKIIGAKFENQFPVIFNENDFNSLKGDTEVQVYAKFNEKISDAKRIEKEKEIISDKLGIYQQSVDIFDKKTENIFIDTNKFCGDAHIFNDINGVTISQQEFNKLKNDAEGKCESKNNISNLIDGNSKYAGLKFNDEDVNDLIKATEHLEAGINYFLNSIFTDANTSRISWQDVPTLNPGCQECQTWYKQNYDWINRIFSHYGQLSNNIQTVIKQILNGESAESFYTKAMQDFSRVKDAMYEIFQIANYFTTHAQQTDLAKEITRLYYLGLLKGYNSSYPYKTWKDGPPLKLSDQENVYAALTDVKEKYNILFEQFKNYNPKEEKKTTSDLPTQFNANVTYDSFSYKKIIDIKSLSSIVDITEDKIANSIVNERNSLTSLSIIVIIFVMVILFFLISLTLNKIINDYSKEFGILKTYGFNTKLISAQFLKIGFVIIILSVLLGNILSLAINISLTSYINSKYYLFLTTNDFVNYSLKTLIISVPSVFILGLIYIVVNRLLKIKAITLLSGNVSIKLVNFIKVKSKELRFKFNIIFSNMGKIWLIIVIAVIITTLITTLSTIFFSTQETYGKVGSEMSAQYINIENQFNTSRKSKEDLIYTDGRFIALYDKNHEQKVTYDYKINDGSPLNINLIGVDKENKEFMYKVNDEIKKEGIYLPLKLKDLYHVNTGDILTFKSYDNELVELRVAGFQKSAENMYAYSSKEYLQSKLNQLGKSNAFFTKVPYIQEKTRYIVNASDIKSQVVSNMNTIMQILVVLIIIFSLLIFPLIWFNTNLIIYEELKEIATMKAIGFNISQIRKIFINPYLIPFVSTIILTLFINIFIIQPNISSLLFSYLSIDVIYYQSFSSAAITALIIITIYQAFIIFSSRKINKIPVSQILTGSVEQKSRTFHDKINKLKEGFRYWLETDKLKNEYKLKNVENISKEEGRTIWKEIWHYTKTIIGIQTVTSAFQTIVSFTSFTIAMATISQQVIIRIANTILTQIEKVYLIQSLIYTSPKYLVSFFVSKNYKMACKVFVIQIQFVLLSMIGTTALFFILAPTIAVFIDNEQLIHYLYLLFILFIIRQSLEFITGTLTQLSTSIFDRRLQIGQSIINNVWLILSTVFVMTQFKWIIKHIDVYLYFSTIPVFFSFIFSMYFCITDSRYRVVVLGSFSKIFTRDKKIYHAIRKTSAPFVGSSFTDFWYSFIYSAVLLNIQAVLGEKFIKFEQYTNIVSSFTTFLMIPIGIITPLFEVKIRNELFTNRFNHALKLKKFFYKYLNWATTIGLVKSIFDPLIVILFFNNDIDQTLLIFSVIRPIIGSLMQYLENIWVPGFTDGGEFRFTATIGIISKITSGIFDIVFFMILQSMVLATIGYVVSSLVCHIVVIRRANTGRWLRNISNTINLK